MFLLDIKALLICGGINYLIYPNSTSNQCYILDKYSSRLFATMSERRTFAASLIINENYLWVTGGLEQGVGPFSSTEYILKNGESVKGPELPLKLFAHTVIGINSTITMFIGGLSEETTIDLGMAATPPRGSTYPFPSLDLTYFYDHYNQVWYDGPKLSFARCFHGVGIVTDLITRERLVIVTGGKSDGSNLLSTEILIDGSWVLGR